MVNPLLLSRVPSTFKASLDKSLQRNQRPMDLCGAARNKKILPPSVKRKPRAAVIRGSYQTFKKRGIDLVPLFQRLQKEINPLTGKLNDGALQLAGKGVKMKPNSIGKAFNIWLVLVTTRWYKCSWKTTFIN